MQFSTDEVAALCLRAINEKITSMKKLNIIVIGKSGVGKSTLINSLFRGRFAETGLGRPVTSEVRKIVKKDYPLTIYDTPGFELSGEQQNKVRAEVINLIHQGLESGNINEAIHCIWYCINVGSNRTFDASEAVWLREFAADNKYTRVPMIVILTQGIPKSKASEMKALVEKENLDIVKVVPLLAQEMKFDEDYTAKPYGLDALIDVMAEFLPDELQGTLQNVQKVVLDSKIKMSRRIVAGAVAASCGTAAAPIPFAHAAVLIPIQISMIAGITAVFGMVDVSTRFLTSFVTATVGSSGSAVLGKLIVENLLKFIPGIGNITGGAISAATAGLLTTALGEAYIKIMTKVYLGEMKKEDLETEKGLNDMKEIFRDELKRDRK